MGFVGKIPGMYFDTEKGKYFKVQHNAPAESAYSSHDIKRRKLQDKRTAVLADEQVRHKGRIRRSILDPLTSGLLARDHGYKERLNAPRVLAEGLVLQAYSNTMLESPYSGIFAALERPDLGSSMIELRTLYYNTLITTRINGDLDNRDETFQQTSLHESLGVSGAPTSISIHAAGQKVVLTFMAGSPDRSIAILPTSRLNREDGSITSIILGPGHSRGSEVDVQSSTVAPDSSSLLFAIGTSEGILTIDKQNMDAHFLTRNLFPPTHSRSVFALEFLSNEPSILMSGGRNGILNVTDLRAPDYGQQPDIIRHQSSITHIRQLDTHRIVVAGLKSSLCQYDLRYRKGPQRTQSILQYPEYHNTARVQIGFDVDLESGIIAAAQEHDVLHSPVQLFSLLGGQSLNSDVANAGGESALRNYDFNRTNQAIEDFQVVPCVRFIRDVGNRMKSLYIAANVVTRYGWGSRDVAPKLLEGGAVNAFGPTGRPGRDTGLRFSTDGRA